MFSYDAVAKKGKQLAPKRSQDGLKSSENQYNLNVRKNKKNTVGRGQK